MNKEKYSEPIVEIVRFNKLNIVMASTGETPGGNNNENGDDWLDPFEFNPFG